MDRGSELFPTFSVSELRHLPPGYELSKIEEGMDSIVLLWKQKGQKDSVLKYYVDSEVTPEMIQLYSQAVNSATQELRIDPLECDIGTISFRIVPVDKVGTVHIADKDIPITQSSYIRGIELEAARYREGTILDILENSDLLDLEKQAILRFSRSWSEPDSLLKQQVSEKLDQINQMLRTFLGSETAGPDEINIKLYGNENGITLYLTDISSNVQKLVSALMKKDE